MSESEYYATEFTDEQTDRLADAGDYFPGRGRLQLHANSRRDAENGGRGRGDADRGMDTPELEMNDYVMNNAQTITKRIRTAAGWTDFVYRALRDLFGRVFPGELIGIEHGPGLEAELFPPARAKRTEEGLGLGMGFGD